MIISTKRILKAIFFTLLLSAAAMPCVAAGSGVNAVILADGTIINIGHCDWTSSLENGQTQVDLGEIEIPDNALTDYIVQGGALVPRPVSSTGQQNGN